MRKDEVITLITIIFVALFFTTGIEKVWDHRLFVITLSRQPLPDWMKGILAWGLPLAELITVALLVIPSTRLMGLYVSLILMLMFTGYTAYASAEPWGFVPCACGKLFNSLSWMQHFWVNLGFVGLAITGIALNKTTLEMSKTKQQIRG